MSPRRSDSGEKPGADVYVGLMFVSVAALIMGIVFLALELQKYDWTPATG